MIQRLAPIPTAVKWLFGPAMLAAGALGLVLLFDGVEALKQIRGWLGFVFLVSFASVFNRVAFGPGERHFTTRTSVGRSRRGWCHDGCHSVAASPLACLQCC
jgi:arginine exporter protein ArgO